MTEQEAQKEGKNPVILWVTIIVSILIALVATFVILSFFAGKNAPKIYFYNGNTLIRDGDVEVGSESYSINSQGFVQPSSQICNSGQTIKLTTSEFSEAKFFDFYPSFCQYKRFEFTVTEEKKQEEILPDKVTFRFFIKETNQNVKGKLYFDSSYKGETQGTIEVTRAECSSISTIMISAESRNITWQNTPTYCQTKTNIEFPVSAEKLN